MALRAGYVGIKKRFLDVLKALPKSIEDGFKNQTQLLEDTVGWTGEEMATTITPDHAIGASGNESENSQFDIIEYMEVTEGDTYVFKGVFEGDLHRNNRIHGYNSNKVWVEQLQLIETSGNTSVNSEFTIPSGIKYIRMSLGDTCKSYSIKHVSVAEVLENLPSGGSDIIIAEHTESTTNYAWITPKDADNNALDPTTDTILSMIGFVSMAGAPPYYGSFAIAINTAVQDSPEYMCKLINTQTNQAAPDGAYTVTYRVAFVRNTQ